MVVKAVTIQNPDALTAQLNALENVASESVLRRAAVAGARLIFDEVKARAPVGYATYRRKGDVHEPGTLRDSILIAYDQEVSVPGRLATYLVTWSKDAFYGRFVEYGTSKMAAQPFLRPGYMAAREAAAKAVGDSIQRQAEELRNGQ